MKTKILILMIAVFIFGSCTKDNINLTVTNIETNNNNRAHDESGDPSDPSTLHWMPFHFNIYYNLSLTQDEIDEIRNRFFNKYNSHHKEIKLISYETISSHYEIWYGEWLQGENVTYPIVNDFTGDLDDEEDVNYY